VSSSSSSRRQQTVLSELVRTQRACVLLWLGALHVWSHALHKGW
jgi:hypothetical protein